MLTTDLRDPHERVNGTCADRTRSGDNHEGQHSFRLVLVDLFGQRIRSQAELVIRVDPSNRLGAQTIDIGRFLQPAVCLCRCIDCHRGLAVPAVRTKVPRHLVVAGNNEPDEVRHVSAAHEDPGTLRRIPQQFRNPSYRL